MIEFWPEWILIGLSFMLGVLVNRRDLQDNSASEGIMLALLVFLWPIAFIIFISSLGDKPSDDS